MSASKISKTDEKYGSDSDNESAPIAVVPAKPAAVAPKAKAPAPAKGSVAAVPIVLDTPKSDDSDSSSSDDEPEEKPTAKTVATPTGSDTDDEEEPDVKLVKKTPAQKAKAVAMPTQASAHMATLTSRKAAAEAIGHADPGIAALCNKFDLNCLMFEDLMEGDKPQDVCNAVFSLMEDLVAKMEKFVQARTAAATVTATATSTPASSAPSTPKPVVKADVPMPDASPAKAQGKGTKRTRPVSPVLVSTPMEEPEAEESSADEAPQPRQIPSKVTADDFDVSSSQKEALEPVDSDLPEFERDLANVGKDNVTVLRLEGLEKKRLAMKAARKEGNEAKVEEIWLLYDKQYKEVQERFTPESWTRRKELVQTRIAQKKDDAAKLAKKHNGGTAPATPKKPVAEPAPAPAPAAASSAPVAPVAPKVPVLTANHEALCDITSQKAKPFADTTPEETKAFERAVAGILRVCACKVGNKERSKLSEVTEMLVALANRVDVPCQKIKAMAGQEWTEESHAEFDTLGAAARTAFLRAQDKVFTNKITMRPAEPTETKKPRKGD